MDSSESFLSALAPRVLSTPERWGWEYQEPLPARPSPELEAEPLWYGPPPPGATDSGLPGLSAPGSGASGPGWTDRGAPIPTGPGQKPGANLPRRIMISGGLLALGVVLGKYGIVFDLAAVVLAGIWFLPLLLARSRPDTSALEAAERERDWVRYREAWQAWRNSVQSWNAGEQARRTIENLWYPVIAAPRTSRVDIFGGVPDGWAAVLTTMGASTLKAGNSLLILDLTEHDIARDLIDVAEVQGLTAAGLELPAELGPAGILHGLSAENIAEIIAEAVHTARAADSADLRGPDADLIRAVVDRLEGPPTFRKISAGLQVLRRSYDDAGLEQPPLGPAEVQRLAEYIDVAGQDDQAQREIKALAINVALLDGFDTGDTRGGESRGGQDFWSAGLLVLRTADHNPRRKDFMDRVLVQTVIHHLRLRAARRSSDVLFVAGCDHLGLATLETLTRQARRAGLRTVLVLEHLRGDVENLLGGSDSASLIMRMGNAREAAAAAEFIGRGHTFVLNRVTRQLSDASTDGEAKQWGATDSVSNTSTVSGHGPHHDRSRSVGVSRADTWSRTVNWSTTKTQSDGTTTSRVYEFTVEPTQIQGMPPTAFIFVEAAGGQRRVIAGDGNPAVSLLDRVADRPRAQATLPASPASSASPAPASASAISASSVPGPSAPGVAFPPAPAAVGGDRDPESDPSRFDPGYVVAEPPEPVYSEPKYSEPKYAGPRSDGPRSAEPPPGAENRPEK